MIVGFTILKNLEITSLLLWFQDFLPQALDDGIMEVVGVTGVMHVVSQGQIT